MDIKRKDARHDCPDGAAVREFTAEAIAHRFSVSAAGMREHKCSLKQLFSGGRLLYVNFGNHGMIDKITDGFILSDFRDKEILCTLVG